MRNVDELKTLPAARILELWRDSREIDPLERALLCNARILARCCFFEGRAVYADESEVLHDLSGRQMEALLLKLADGGGSLPPQPFVNPAFDLDRFRTLGVDR